MTASTEVRGIVSDIARRYVGKRWWMDVEQALVDKFAPILEENERLRNAQGPNAGTCQCPRTTEDD